MAEYTIPPDHAARAAGNTPNDNCNWRNLGWMDGIGVRHHRGWLYSVEDVCAHIAPLTVLSRYGLGLAHAHAVVRRRATEIREVVQAKLQNAAQPGDDLCVILPLRVPARTTDGRAECDGPEALLHVNFS
jgi:hypothetical protein